MVSTPGSVVLAFATMGGGGGGPALPSQILADQLTLSQPFATCPRIVRPSYGPAVLNLNLRISLASREYIVKYARL